MYQLPGSLCQTLFPFQVLSFIGFMLMRASYPLLCLQYEGCYSFFDTMSWSLFITRTLLFVLFVVSVKDKHCPKIIPWLLLVSIHTGVTMCSFIIILFVLFVVSVKDKHCPKIIPWLLQINIHTGCDQVFLHIKIWY